MLIRKTQQPSDYPENQIHDAYSTSAAGTYSCNYVNEILKNLSPNTIIIYNSDSASIKREKLLAVKNFESDSNGKPAIYIDSSNTSNDIFYFLTGINLKDKGSYQSLNFTFSNNEKKISLGIASDDTSVNIFEKDNCNFTLTTSGNWTMKKYDNGLVEMFHKITSTFDINQQYIYDGNPGPSWCQTPSYNYPITLTEIISSNTTVISSGHLTSFNYSTSGLTSYQGYLYDAQSISNHTVTLYTTVVGKWK